MQNRIFSWVAVLILLALPLLLIVSGQTTRQRGASPLIAKPEATHSHPAESTQRMARRLQQLSEQIDIKTVLWGANERRVILWKERLAKAPDWKAQLPAEFFLAEAFLQDGQNEECLRRLDHMESLGRKNGAAFSPKDRQDMRMTRVQAHMRIGETQNCCAEHNGDSCLMPLQGQAIYQHQEGPRLAIHLLEEQLAEFPKDATARWLLNIAYMTKGEYPENVPPQWLIDPKVFEYEYDIKRFPEIAPAAGLDTLGLSGGAIVDDFDGDTFRAVYTVRFAKAVYVLHAFQKKSKRGTATPRTELDMIERRLKRAQEDYERWSRNELPESR